MTTHEYVTAGHLFHMAQGAAKAAAGEGGWNAIKPEWTAMLDKVGAAIHESGQKHVDSTVPALTEAGQLMVKHGGSTVRIQQKLTLALENQRQVEVQLATATEADELAKLMGYADMVSDEIKRIRAVLGLTG